MNGKTAKMLRGHIGNPGQTQYEVMPGTQRHKFGDMPMGAGPGVQTATIQLDPACGRKRYRNLKKQYRAARAGALTGTLAWPTGL